MDRATRSSTAKNQLRLIVVELVMPADLTIGSVDRELATSHLLLADGFRLIDMTYVTKRLYLPTILHPSIPPILANTCVLSSSSATISARIS